MRGFVGAAICEVRSAKNVGFCRGADFRIAKNIRFCQVDDLRIAKNIRFCQVGWGSDWRPGLQTRTGICGGAGFCETRKCAGFCRGGDLRIAKDVRFCQVVRQANSPRCLKIRVFVGVRDRRATKKIAGFCRGADGATIIGSAKTLLSIWVSHSSCEQMDTPHESG